MEDTLLTELTASEHRDFQYIVGQARGAGWIDTADELVAIREARHILVCVNRPGHRQRTKCYATDKIWLFQLLHDLAHGWWRAGGGPLRREP